jgi:hypothetical protein
MAKDLTNPPLGNNITSLVSSISRLIEESRARTAVTVNAEITLLYWNVGKYIKEDILKNNRADYGQKIIASISQKLTASYGKGWSEKHLRHCLHIVEIFPDEQILYTLCRELSWTYIHSIITCYFRIKNSYSKNSIMLLKLQNKNL